jgi:hypothetical protein
MEGHAWPQVPQFDVVFRLDSHPLAYCPSQLAKPTLHVAITHTPPLHAAVPLATVWQSLTVEHDVRQAVPEALQVYGEHCFVAPAWHVPAPSHVPAAVATPLLQVAVVQVVPDGYMRHLPVASHAPDVPHDAAP